MGFVIKTKLRMGERGSTVIHEKGRLENAGTKVDIN